MQVYVLINMKTHMDPVQFVFDETPNYKHSEHTKHNHKFNQNNRVDSSTCAKWEKRPIHFKNITSKFYIYRLCAHIPFV